MKISACTIVARNYLAHARVLCESLLAQHPDGDFTVLVIDDEQQQVDASRESFRCLRLTDIGLDRAEIGRLAAIYDVTELATAVKPVLLRHLLSTGRTNVIYLDPDIRVFGSLQEASRLACQHAIVLTPHMTEPVPRDGRRIDEFHILASGVYNLGFIAVGPRSEAFIDWWWQKTRRDALVDHNRMMFTDQRWVDFVPSFFEHWLLKDPTYNVAYWNLHARDLTWTGERYLVNGSPLTFFHFSGFDTRKPHLLSKHQGDRPRILLSERPALAQLCREYVASLERAGLAQASALPYGWSTLPSGVPFDRRMRRLYREGLEAHEKGRGPEPPNPYDDRADARFMDWLNEPVPVGLHPRVSRYLHALYKDRVDLQSAFPNLAGHDCERYFEWLRADGVTQVGIPADLLPPARETSGPEPTYVPVSRLTEGVNIAGYFRAELGVGEAARLLTSAVEAAGIPHSTIAYDVTSSRKAHAFVERGDGRAPHDINIICVNADRTPDFAKDAGSGLFQGRHTVGYWFWELEQFPPLMHAGFDFVDEVWAATRFVAKGIEAIGRRPVYTIPLPVPVPVCSPDVTRQSLRLPSGFMFLFIFDFFSILERKNPIGVIRAFSRAFRPNEGPVLVIKTINGDQRLNDLERLRAAIGDRPDIQIVDEYYSAEQKNALVGLCDCYVSLHRSEGLGLTMAEAMGLQKPVIATAYSGNLDFMTPENSYLVNYTMSAVPAGCDPYVEGSPWADPDLEQAAEYMRRVWTSRDESEAKARQGRQDILTKHNVAVASRGVEQRVNDIRRARRSRAAAAQAAFTSTTGAESRSTLSPLEVPSLALLDHVESLLTPTASAAPGRLLRRPVLMAQQLLLKVLRPYWWQQRQIHKLLVEALRETAQSAARAANTGPHQRQALEALWTAVHSLQSDRSGSEDRIQQSVDEFQTTASAHLKALTEQLAETTAEARTLSQRLYAVPYMDQPDRFSYTDADGRHVLGFGAKRETAKDVYLGFEDVFRGSERFIRERFRTYLPLLRRHERVFEIGCGRGELLDLLRDAGVPATGMDVDEAMVRRCRAKGHTVEQIDAIGFLRQQADSSVPAIFSAQVVEHLAYDDLIAFLELSRAKLKVGGQLIFETVNPHALEAFKTFWTDLTHQRPIFPEVAVAWCWLLGFDRAHVFFPHGSGDLEQDRRTQGEYTVVATKSTD